MILTLSKKDYLNTILKDESGRAVYQINTPGSAVFGGRTTITRLADQTYHDIAQIKWNAFSPDEFHQQRRTVDAKERSPLVRAFTFKRKLIACNGQSYVRKEGSNGVKLDHAGAPRPRVAEYHTRSLGVFSKRHPAYIEVANEGVPILDDIVASFVYVEKQRQSRRNGAGAAGAGAASGGAY